MLTPWTALLSSISFMGLHFFTWMTWLMAWMMLRLLPEDARRETERHDAAGRREDLVALRPALAAPRIEHEIDAAAVGERLDLGDVVRLVHDRVVHALLLQERVLPLGGDAEDGAVASLGELDGREPDNRPRPSG